MPVPLQPSIPPEGALPRMEVRSIAKIGNRKVVDLDEVQPHEASSRNIASYQACPASFFVTHPASVFAG